MSSRYPISRAASVPSPYNPGSRASVARASIVDAYTQLCLNTPAGRRLMSRSDESLVSTISQLQPHHSSSTPELVLNLPEVIGITTLSNSRSPESDLKQSELDSLPLQSDTFKSSHRGGVRFMGNTSLAGAFKNRNQGQNTKFFLQVDRTPPKKLRKGRKPLFVSPTLPPTEEEKDLPPTPTSSILSDLACFMPSRSQARLSTGSATSSITKPSKPNNSPVGISIKEKANGLLLAVSNAKFSLFRHKQKPKHQSSIFARCCSPPWPSDAFAYPSRPVQEFSITQETLENTEDENVIIMTNAGTVVQGRRAASPRIRFGDDQGEPIRIHFIPSGNNESLSSLDGEEDTLSISEDYASSQTDDRTLRMSILSQFPLPVVQDTQLVAPEPTTSKDSRQLSTHASTQSLVFPSGKKVRYRHPSQSTTASAIQYYFEDAGAPPVPEIPLPFRHPLQEVEEEGDDAEDTVVWDLQAGRDSETDYIVWDPATFHRPDVPTNPFVGEYEAISNENEASQDLPLHPHLASALHCLRSPSVDVVPNRFTQFTQFSSMSDDPSSEDISWQSRHIRQSNQTFWVPSHSPIPE